MCRRLHNCFAPPQLRTLLGSRFLETFGPSGTKELTLVPGVIARLPVVVLHLATADELDDLYSIAYSQTRLPPLIASDYALIKFDGDARGRQ